MIFFSSKKRDYSVYVTCITVSIDEGTYVLHSLRDDLPKVLGDELVGCVDDMTDTYIITITGFAPLAMVQRQFLTLHGFKYGYSVLVEGGAE